MELKQGKARLRFPHHHCIKRTVLELINSVIVRSCSCAFSLMVVRQASAFEHPLLPQSCPLQVMPSQQLGPAVGSPSVLMPLWTLDRGLEVYFHVVGQVGVLDRLWPLQTLPDGRNDAHPPVLIFSLTPLIPDTEIRINRPPDLLAFRFPFWSRWTNVGGAHCFSSPPALHLLYYNGRRWPTEDVLRCRLRLLHPSRLLYIQLIGFSSSTRF
jgi:hypothetical protein